MGIAKLNKRVSKINLCIFFFVCLSCDKGISDDPIKNSSYIPEEFPYPDENSDINDIFSYGTIQWGKGNYEEALNSFTTVYNKAKKTNDGQLMAKSLNNIGLVYWKLGDTKTALKSYEESGRLAEKNNIDNLVALTYANRAIILKDEGAYGLAKELNKKAIDILKKINVPRDLAIAYNNQGRVFSAQSMMDSALFYYLKALKIYDTIDYKDGKSTTHENLSEIYSSRNLKKEAIEHARKSLGLALESGSASGIEGGYRRLFEVYKHFSMLDSAMIYQQKYVEHKEMLFEKYKSQKLFEYQSKLGSELQKLRIENLEKEREIIKNRLWMSLGTVLIVSLALMLFLYRRSSKIELKKQQLQKDLEHSKSIIHIKQKELKAYILDFSQKSNQVNELQNELNKIIGSNELKIAELLSSKILTDEDWKKFKSKFNLIYPHFIPKIKRLKANITEAEVRYLVLHHLKLSQKEMASVLGISTTSVRTCKMRLKRKLHEENYDSVEEFVSE